MDVDDAVTPAGNGRSYGAPTVDSGAHDATITDDEQSGPDTYPRRLLDRCLVHKSAASEVLLLSYTPLDSDTYEFAFEVPRGHPANGYPAAQRLPLLLGLELVRQSGIAVAHLGESVRMDWKILLRSIAFSWEGSAPHYPQFRPLRGRHTVHVATRRYRRGVVAGITADVRLHSAGAGTAHGTGDIDFLPPQTYKALGRGRSVVRSSEAQPPLVDVRRTGDELRATLGVDPHDPFIFDHDCDHVPGMLLAKAAIAAHEQIIEESPCGSIELRCDKFAEFGAPVRLVARRLHGETHILLQQNEAVIAEAVCVNP